MVPVLEIMKVFIDPFGKYLTCPDTDVYRSYIPNYIYEVPPYAVDFTTLYNDIKHRAV